MKKSKATTLVTMGVFQIIHAVTHIIPTITALITATEVEHPFGSFIWFGFGVVSLYIGWKEFNYHNDHE